MKQKQIFALGFFDGVHLGHQALLRECIRLAEQQNMCPAALTFDRHPQSLFTQSPPPVISSVQERQALLRRYGMKQVLCLPVTKEMMGTNWTQFLERLVEQGGSGFVCGDDFRFGRGGEGTAKKLAQFCRERAIPCVIVPEQTVDGVRVSSTYIRELLEQGCVEEANRFLGHAYLFTGTVVPGKQLGRTIGFPTANLPLLPDRVCLKKGVYACRAEVEQGVFPAVVNVGTQPTVDGTSLLAECHLLDFQGELYGKDLTVCFEKFLRPEQKFSSLENLQQEIAKNRAQTRKFFESF